MNIRNMTIEEVEKAITALEKSARTKDELINYLSDKLIVKQDIIVDLEDTINDLVENMEMMT